MKIILSGYEGSKKILTASSWLVNKYLPDFDVYWLNYGKFGGKLFCGSYVSLKDEQISVDSWSEDIREFLKSIDDEFIIFALDDYLISTPINVGLYNLIDFEDQVEINLCSASKPEDTDYSVTTQYSIWKRTFLIEVLEQVNTPWEFEIIGSKYMNGLGLKTSYVPALTYPEHSSLSSRWSGIRTEGVKTEDIEWLTNNKYLCI